MLEKFGFKKKLSLEQEISNFLQNHERQNRELAYSRLKMLNYYNYTYDATIATEELGLDDELVLDLVEDYIFQILRATTQFIIYIEEIEAKKATQSMPCYVNLRNLAHKNLGVAKNLRIEDAKILLSAIQSNEDTAFLRDCLVALEACAVRLNPRAAFEAKQLLL